MAAHVAFLRGINLGKNRRVKNERLRARLRGPRLRGGRDLPRQRQRRSSSGRGAPRISRPRVEAGLAEALGFEVAGLPALARQVRRSPPTTRSSAAGRGVGGQAPGRAAAGQAERQRARRRRWLWRARRTRLAIRGGELYWLPSGGMIDSELDLKALEALVGPWTMRTKGTIEQIAEKHLALTRCSSRQARSARGSAATSISALTAPISSGSSESLDVGDELHLAGRAGGRSCRSGSGRRPRGSRRGRIRFQ